MLQLHLSQSALVESLSNIRKPFSSIFRIFSTIRIKIPFRTILKNVNRAGDKSAEDHPMKRNFRNFRRSVVKLEPELSNRPIRRKQHTLKSQSELKVKTRKMSRAREQLAIGLSG